MDERTNNLGLAIDVGTTTIRASLIDLNEKKVITRFSCLNEQITFGHDVISRIKFCLQNPRGLEKLNKKIISSINFVIENLLSIAGRDKKDLSLIAAVGNAAIYHFVLSLPVRRLTEPPYQPESKDLVRKDARSLGIEVGKGCEFIFLPNAGGFVGSDAIAVMLATGLDISDTPLLAVDIGTNGEIILGSKERIFVASTAAGPAFEGWHTSCGMRSVEGAIEFIVDEGGRINFKVMGGGEPKGISGSGLIDIVAILLKRGYIDKSGKMVKDFAISDSPKRLFVSPEDIRGVQLAKAAFSVGIKFLRRRSNKPISKFFITGNFGNALNKNNARSIGIIPQDIELGMVEYLPDGALQGAELYIKDRDRAIARIDNILAMTEHVSLSQEPDFQKEFSSSMKF